MFKFLVLIFGVCEAKRILRGREDRDAGVDGYTHHSYLEVNAFGEHFSEQIRNATARGDATAKALGGDENTIYEGVDHDRVAEDEKAVPSAGSRAVDAIETAKKDILGHMRSVELKKSGEVREMTIPGNATNEYGKLLALGDNAITRLRREVTTGQELIKSTEEAAKKEVGKAFEGKLDNARSYFDDVRNRISDASIAAIQSSARNVGAVQNAANPATNHATHAVTLNPATSNSTGAATEELSV